MPFFRIKSDQQYAINPDTILAQGFALSAPLALTSAMNIDISFIRFKKIFNLNSIASEFVFDKIQLITFGSKK